MDSSPPLYHERQHLLLCGKHALNHLLQRPRFTKQQLDAISTRLHQQEAVQPSRSLLLTYPFNAYCSVLGLGNYTADVLHVALKSEGLCIEQFDRRDSVEGIQIQDRRIKGILANKEQHYIYGLYHTRHWYAIIPTSTTKETERARGCGHSVSEDQLSTTGLSSEGSRVQERVWWELDSKREKPEQIGDDNQLFEYLKALLIDNKNELLVVVKEGTSREEIFVKR